MSQDAILWLLITGWTARDELVLESIDTCATAVVFGDATWDEIGAQLRKPLGTFPDFPADFIANSGEIAEFQTGNTKQVMNGMDAHAIENVPGLQPVAQFGDATGTVETTGDHFDAVGIGCDTGHRLECLSPCAQHFLGVAKPFGDVAAHRSGEESGQAVA